MKQLQHHQHEVVKENGVYYVKSGYWRKEVKPVTKYSAIEVLTVDEPITNVRYSAQSFVIECAYHAVYIYKHWKGWLAIRFDGGKPTDASFFKEGDTVIIQTLSNQGVTNEYHVTFTQYLQVSVE